MNAYCEIKQSVGFHMNGFPYRPRVNPKCLINPVEFEATYALFRLLYLSHWSSYGEERGATPILAGGDFWDLRKTVG